MLQRDESSAHLLARWSMKETVSHALPPAGCKRFSPLQTCLHVTNV